jgi:hypothetical protein
MWCLFHDNECLFIMRLVLRAHLIVAKPVNGDVQYFECPPELTMARCGVETGKRFHIHMDEEVDELQEDS